MITTNNATLADRMRDARKRAGLKQRDLTHIASRSQIGRIERGEVYSPETIDAWAAACGVSAEWLRTGVEAAPEAPAEADRSGWPVLTKARAMAGYYHPNGTMAIEPYYGVFRAWPATWETLPVHPIGKFDTAVDAAEALGARLPDEVSEAAQTVTPQPPPTNTAGDVWQELIDAEPPGRIRDLMVARREQGIAKYGRPLGRENGRDHTADAIQEALDGMVYARAARRMLSEYAFRDALDLLTGADARGWVRRTLVDKEIATLTARAESAEAEVARLRAALEGQTLANAPLRDALSFLRGRLAFLVPGDGVTDAAIVAAAKALADRDDGQDDALLGAGLGLLDQAALGNPTLGYIATVIRRGVGL